MSQWLIASLAGVGAVTFSHPFDVAKTRLQLQNELVARGQGEVVYRHAMHCMGRTVREEGMAALYHGVGPAWAYNAVMQGLRLGVFSVLVEASPVASNAGVDLVAGFAGGMVSAAVASPLSLVKVRMQTAGSRVGVQYRYRSLLDGLRSIYRHEGLAGLFAGSWASQLRVGVGSAAQLASYKWSKQMLGAHLAPGYPLYLAASAVGGVATVLAMNPLDVASTRLYNSQGRYRGVADCLVRTVRKEGFFALWKGLSGQYLRIVPHSVLIIVFSEALGFKF